MATETISIEIKQLTEIRNALSNALVIIDSYLNKTEKPTNAKAKKPTHKDRVNKYM